MISAAPLQSFSRILLSWMTRRPSRALGWVFPFVVLILAAPAEALELRVAVEQNARSIQVGASTTATIKDVRGNTLGRLKAQMGNMATAVSGKVDFGDWEAQQLWVEPEEDGLIWIGDTWYRGRVLLTPTSQGLTAVNHVDLEEYLYSVVASEMPTSWPLEALKAQSVAARTYALNKRDRNNDLYDLGDTTKYQVYKGAAKETESTRTAVEETAGEVLTYGGNLIEAFFHSSSGGHTENVEDVWSKPLPYLRGVPDFDQDSPKYSWTESVSAYQLRQKLASRVDGLGNIGDIVSLVPQQTSPHGRIKTIRVVGQYGDRVIKGSALRTALGLKSTRFDIQSGSDFSKSSGNRFVFQGYGYGHGIGMSQYGAKSMAQRGNGYENILAHYYQGVALSQMQ